MEHHRLVGLDLHSPSNEQIENNTGSTITKGKLVKITALGTTYPEIQIISSLLDRPRGIAPADILNGASGDLVLSFGRLNNFDTSAWVVGTELFSDTNGDLTTTDTGLCIGTVLKQDVTTGVIFVNVGLRGVAGVDGGTITVQKDGAGDITSVNTLNFEGDVLLTDQGGGKVKVSIDTAEKSVFTPFQRDNTNLGNYRVFSIGSSGSGSTVFAIPVDFGTLVRVDLIGSPTAGAAGAGEDIDFFSDYAGEGEAITVHSESDTTSVYDFTGAADQWFHIDISAVFSSLTASDVCGLLVDHQGVGGSIRYWGIELHYIPAI